MTFWPSVAWADADVLKAHDPIAVATASAKANLLRYVIACSEEGSTLGSFYFSGARYDEKSERSLISTIPMAMSRHRPGIRYAGRTGGQEACSYQVSACEWRIPSGTRLHVPFHPRGSVQ